MPPHSSHAAAAANDGVASWYTPGLADGFGDRLLMFDNTETDSLELLRFYPSLSAIGGFENALHERVRQIGRIPDHAFPLIVAVERLEGDGALALVSTHIPGKRLSVFFDRPGPRRGLNPSFVTGIVTQIVQALAVLQSKGDGIAHCALTPERVVITTGGRVCLVEHVLGSALVQLNLSASQLWREFGLVTIQDPSGAVRLDARTDVFQLGVLALEMLIGRRVPPQDLKDRLTDLLDQWSFDMARAGLASDRLRAWLERALQIGSRPYANAAEAYADLRDMPAESAASAFESLTGDVVDIGTRRPAPAPAWPVPAPAQAPEARLAAAPAPITAPIPPAPAPKPELVSPEPAATTRIREASPEPVPAPVPTPPPAPPAQPKYTPPPPAARQPEEQRTLFGLPLMSPWVAAVLGLVIVAEAVVIAALVLRRPDVTQAAEPVEAVEAAAPVDAPVPANEIRTPIPDGEQRVPTSTTASGAPATGQNPPAPPRDPIAAAAIRQRSGGVRLQSPIELKVLEGEKVLGSSVDGPIVASAGTHQLDLINAELGLRLRHPVTFVAGQITMLDVPIPPGRVNFNAQPWAEVAIGGKVLGETPLANVSVPIGRHEVVFRHPELGERRQNIVVRADGPTKVSTTFER